MALVCDYLDFGSPFNDSDADVILRSRPVPADVPLEEIRTTATHFRVHKLFLIKASSVFERLLSETSSSLSPNHDKEPNIRRDSYDDLLVLCLSEDCDTLHSLLTAIYPTDVNYPRTLEAMMKTYAAAKKYCMSSVLTLFRTYRSGVGPVVTTENAFRAYLFAFNEGLREEALEAARLTLTLPQTFETYGKDLCNASGPALQALWKHRQASLRAVEMGIRACVLEVGDLRGWRNSSPRDKSCCAEPGTRPRDQFLTFTRRLVADLSLMNFCNFIETMSAPGGFKCPSCKAPVRFDLFRLFSCLERHVNDSIERASPVLPYGLPAADDEFLQMRGELLSLFDPAEEVADARPSREEPRKFGKPFDRLDADLIIRSCDQVDFHVHKVVLGIASVVFEDMFTAPGPPPHEKEQGVPVITLTEDSKTLHHLLTAIYPVDPIISGTIEDALFLLATCQKYEMDSTAYCVRSLLKERKPPLVTVFNSFRAYGIASRYHLKEEALLAARLTLERPMNFNACSEDLRFISGADLFRLWGYHNECIKAAKNCIGQMKKHGDGFPPLSKSCSGSVNIGKYDTEALQSVPRWWHGHFFNRVGDRPSPKTITDRPAFERALVAHRSASSCVACLQPDDTRMDNTICAAFEAKLTAAINQVSVSPRRPVGTC